MAANKDNIPLWAISGIIGVLLRDVWSLVAQLIGLAKHLVWEIGADVFLEPNQVKTFLGAIVGFLTDFVTASLIGVIFGFFIKRTGKEYCLLKGWGVDY